MLNGTKEIIFLRATSGFVLLWMNLARKMTIHTAFDIAPEEFEAFTERVISSGATVFKENKSEGNSLYILDPDGHKLEIHSGSLTSRLEALKAKPYSGLIWL